MRSLALGEGVNRCDLLILVDEVVRTTAGTESQLVRVIRMLVEHGIAVRVVVLRKSPALSLALPDVSISCVDFERVRNPFAWHRLIQVASDAKGAGCRRVWTFLNDSSLVAPMLLSWLGFRVYVSRRDVGYWMTGFRRMAAIVLRSRVSRWIVNSGSVARATVSLELARPDRIRVVPNLMPRQEWLEVVQCSDFCERPLRVAVIANIAKHKRLDVVLEAIRILRQRGIPIELEVAGAVDKEPLTFVDLLSQMNRSGLDGAVRFVGSRNDISAFLSDKCMVISASMSEGLSNAVIEAMCHGRLVVCSRVPGNVDAVLEGETGLLFTAGSASELATLIESSIRNPAKAVEIASRAKAVALDGFSSERVRQALFEALELDGAAPASWSGDGEC